MFKKISMVLLVLTFIMKYSYAQPDNTTDKLSIASVLQSNMVIQQGKLFKVWGKAMNGSKITIAADWDKQKYKTTAVNGEWMVQIKMPTINKGDFTAHTMTINSGDEKIELKNLLIGEVWIASGQSNMSMYMKPFLPYHYGAENYQQEIAAADYPSIRLLTVEKSNALTPQDSFKGEWKLCNPENVATFSVISYYFARELFKDLNVPVGVVVSAYGGAAAQAFTAREVLTADKELNELYVEPYLASPEAKGVTARPSLIYNAMIYPLKNLSISGFIWYQGESNAGIHGRYPKLCTAMFNGWRKDFNQGDLPFYYPQVTPYNWKKHNPLEYGYAIFREEQESILALKNTGMICTMDVGDSTIVHPSRKRQIGERLGWLALNKTYGMKNMQYEGPRYKEIKVVGDSVFVSYKKETLSNGLILQEGTAPLHFWIAGKDKIFYPATAVIVGNEVHLYSKQVKDPVAVRYAFTNYPFTNLANRKGIPAFPFRTDNWDKVTLRME